MENFLPFIYGTAWKREETDSLVSSAIASGFRSLDTAAQPKHYREDLTGIALRSSLSSFPIKRRDLFVQPCSSPTYQALLMHPDTNKIHLHHCPRPIRMSLQHIRAAGNTDPQFSLLFLLKFISFRSRSSISRCLASPLAVPGFFHDTASLESV